MCWQLYDTKNRNETNDETRVNVFYECIKYKLLLVINNIFIC